MSELERAIGRMEGAIKGLDKSITGFREDVKTLTIGIQTHHDRLQQGDHQFDKLSNRIRNTMIWCGVITGMLVMRYIPAADEFIRTALRAIF